MNNPSRFPRHPLMLLLIPVAIAIFGFIVMMLWNALMPEIFRLPPINFWQAVGLFILSRLLLGGFGGGPGARRDRRREAMYHMRERWQHMNPQQREKFRRLWKERWDIDLEEKMPGE